MSWTNDESENSEPKEKVIKIQVDRSSELEAKDEQIEDLKAKMELFASTEFNRQADFVEKMGYKRPSTPDELEETKDQIEDKKHNKNPSGIAPLSGQGHSRDYGGYEDYQSMVKDLREKSAYGTKDEKDWAKRVLDELTVKAHNQLVSQGQFSGHMVFDSRTKEWRKPTPSEAMDYDQGKN